MRRIFFLGFFVVLFLDITLCELSDPTVCNLNDGVDSIKNKVYGLKSVKNHDQLLECYRLWLKWNPYELAPYFEASKILSQKHQYEHARILARMAIMLNPADTDAMSWVFLAKLERKSNSFYHALSSLKKAYIAGSHDKHPIDIDQENPEKIVKISNPSLIHLISHELCKLAAAFASGCNSIKTAEVMAMQVDLGSSITCEYPEIATTDCVQEALPFNPESLFHPELVSALDIPHSKPTNIFTIPLSQVNDQNAAKKMSQLKSQLNYISNSTQRAKIHQNIGDILSIPFLTPPLSATLAYHFAFQEGQFEEKGIYFGQMVFTNAISSIFWDQRKDHEQKLAELIENGAKPFPPGQLFPFSIANDRLLSLLSKQWCPNANNNISHGNQPIPAAQDKTNMGRRISKYRIGFISTDWSSAHPVGRNLEYFFQQLFEIYQNDWTIIVIDIMDSTHSTSAVEEWVKSYSHAYHRLPQDKFILDQMLANQIKSFNLDVIIDLNGFTYLNRIGIFSYRLAPIQIGWFGYPTFTYCPYMDYIISNENTIPIQRECNENGICTNKEDNKQNESIFREKIIYLPETHLPSSHKLHYQHLPKSRLNQFYNSTEDHGETLPGIKDDDEGIGNVSICVFLTHQELLHKDLFESWLTILANLTGDLNNADVFDYRLTIKSLSKSSTSILTERIFGFNLTGMNKLNTQGAKYILLDNVKFVSFITDHSSYMEKLGKCEIVLDFDLYNMHTKSLDCLWMGVPILTIPGSIPPRRMTYALLKSLGLDQELVASDYPDFINKTISLARNKKRMDEISKQLLDSRNNSVLFDMKLFAENFYNAISKLL